MGRQGDKGTRRQGDKGTRRTRENLVPKAPKAPKASEAPEAPEAPETSPAPEAPKPLPSQSSPDAGSSAVRLKELRNRSASTKKLVRSSWEVTTSV